MPLWLQHLLVLLLVAACVGYALWGAVRTLVGKGSRVGSCCAKGCSADGSAKPRAAVRTMFLPVELLQARRK